MHGSLPGKGLGCWACKDTARRTAARPAAPIATKRRSWPLRLIPFARGLAQSWWIFTAPHTTSNADSDEKTLSPSETHPICPRPCAIMVEFHSTLHASCNSLASRIRATYRVAPKSAKERHCRLMGGKPLAFRRSPPPFTPPLGLKAQPSSRAEGVSQGGRPRKGEEAVNFLLLRSHSAPLGAIRIGRLG